MEYLLHILIMVNIYVILVLAANLPVGMASLLSMCQAAFYGIGAYLGAWFLLQFTHLPILAVAVAVMLPTGLASLLVSHASIKLKGDYFVLATLGFQMITYTILYNWIPVTKGPYGIPGIPRLRLLGTLPLDGILPCFLLTTFLALATTALFLHLKKSPFGRALKAIRNDELSVSALGRDPLRFKRHAFFLSAAFSGLAGLLYASYISYIDPTSFTVDESIFILCALFIGGIGNIRGPVLGAVFVVLLPEILRFVGLPDALAANLRQIIYGLLLIVVMYFRPRGLCGENTI
jgi:branched-chain amino acid transport system permease protein